VLELLDVGGLLVEGELAVVGSIGIGVLQMQVGKLADLPV
jgi:hypothetical protein